MKTRTECAAEGFSLLEVLIAISIMAGLAALATVSYRPFAHSIDLQTATQQLLTTIHQARDRTLSSEGASNYGVHFASDQYVLFKGAVYNAGAADNEVNALPPKLAIYDISLGGGSDVVFDRLAGTTVSAGSVSLRLVNTPEQSTTISILPTGQASLAGSTALTDSRLVDTRHAHFTLTASIQNSTTLKLDFGSVIATINMADYFNAGKTVFDWQGTVSVAGTDQTLRIHTHQLGPASTLLSIHRDRRSNTAAVTISVDSQQIVAYAADGAATVGPLGGTMEIQ